MTYAVHIASPLVALLLLLIGLIVLTVVLIARPWRSRPAGLADQLRIGAEARGAGQRERIDISAGSNRECARDRARDHIQSHHLYFSKAIDRLV